MKPVTGNKGSAPPSFATCTRTRARERTTFLHKYARAREQGGNRDD